MTILRTSTPVPAVPPRSIPDATIARLPLYLRALAQLSDVGEATCSSEELARRVGITSAQIRKDLSFLGSQGTRGVGYDVEQLTAELGELLGHDREWPIVIVGAGHLGSALATYPGFAKRRLNVVAVLDIAPHLIGTTLGSVPVRAVADLDSIVAEYGAVLGAVATPPESAQDAVDLLVSAGIRSVLNFAPVAVQVPDEVELRHLDVASELQILAYHEQRREVVSA